MQANYYVSHSLALKRWILIAGFGLLKIIQEEMRQWSCSKQEIPQQKPRRLKKGKLEENESNE